MNSDLMNQCRRTVLPNGLSVVSSYIPAAQSVSIGMFVAMGGRYETPSLSGISHFLEHMLFKGTGRRSALEISQTIEGSGGNLNAYTSEDDTCFIINMPYERMSLATDILTDMYLHAKIDSVEFERERDVILEEIKMYDDQPDSVVQTNLDQALFKDHALGRSLSGTEQTLMPMNAQTLLDYKRKTYVPAATVFSFAGRVDHEACVEEVVHKMGGLPAGSPASFLPVDAATGIQNLVVEPREVYQVQSVLGFRACSRNDVRRYPARILQCLLGGNMSSRLFQRVREQEGLCYYINAGLTCFDDVGSFEVSFGADPSKTEKALRLIAEELRKMADGQFSENDLAAVKEFMNGSRRLQLESSMKQMLLLGGYELGYRRLPDVDEEMERFMRVTKEEVQSVACSLFCPEQMALSLVVPKTKKSTEVSDSHWLDVLSPLTA